MSNSFVYTQCNTVTDAVLRIDNKLFEVASEKMIWSGKTKSFNPDSANEVIEELERLIVRNMKSNGVIK